jgi:hypothetical protein
MGVTVYFEGRLKGAQAFSSLLLYVEEIGRAETLLTERVENAHAKLRRVREERPWDYIGPTKGILLYLHEDCEPLRLEFDRELYVQEWVKTQFAGVETHVRLIQILRDIKRFFRTFTVNDEGEYWESENKEALAEHIRRCNEVIAEIRREKSPRSSQSERTQRKANRSDRIEWWLFFSLQLPIRFTLRNPPLLRHFLERDFLVDLLFHHDLLNSLVDTHPRRRGTR